MHYMTSHPALFESTVIFAQLYFQAAFCAIETFFPIFSISWVAVYLLLAVCIAVRDDFHVRQQRL